MKFILQWKQVHFLKKGDMKSTKWIKSYENRNVEIGLKCGLQKSSNRKGDVGNARFNEEVC